MKRWIAALLLSGISLATRAQVLPAPIIDPAGGYYATTQSVILVGGVFGGTVCGAINATPTASVAGTCDGFPTFTYSGPISVSVSSVVNAINTKATFTNSPVATQQYLIVPAGLVTLTGAIQASNGLPASNFNIAFTPSQWFYIAGTGAIVNTTTFCATSVDGTVHGIGNPLTSSVVTPAFTGTLPPGNYFSFYTFYTATGTQTLPSPEVQTQLTGTGQIQIAAPTSGIPAGVVGMNVYIGITSGGETYQGQTVSNATYIQNVALVTGAAAPTANNTICQQVANDAGWPTGTGYTVSLTDPQGNTYPGYPMMWQLLGPGTTINLANGLPYYNGIVTYPIPILASPTNHAPQSISGPLSMTGYDVLNVGELGVGTGLPAWGVDVEGSGLAGAINSKTGYLINGGAGTSGQAPCSDGSYIDEFCSFIPTGTTFFYQTVEDNATALPQEPKLNLIPGSNTTITCADNSGSTRTDCTFASQTNVGPNPNTPTIAFTSPATGSLTSGSNDGAGEVSVTNGGSGSGATVFTITFGGTYSNKMFCVIGSSQTPNNFVTGAVSSVTGFNVVNEGTGGTPLIHYLCHQ